MKCDDHEPRPIYGLYEDCDECNNKAIRVRSMLGTLGIPYYNSTNQDGSPSPNIKISGQALYDILMDEEKLRVLISKLRNKAFW